MAERCRGRRNGRRGRCALPGAAVRPGAAAVPRDLWLDGPWRGGLRRDAAAGGPVPLPGTLGRSLPISVAIPEIQVNAQLARVGRGVGGVIGTLPAGERGLAGWYEPGPSPGEPGAAVLVGRLDSGSGPAVFARLRELEQGDLVGVVRADETVAVFRVTSAEQVPKARFPAARVHAAGDRPELRLVTCAGRYDEVRHAYADCLIVYATFAAAYRLADLVRI